MKASPRQWRSSGGDLMAGYVKLLNGMYAVARKKTELTHQDRDLIRAAAATLENTLRENEMMKARLYETEERLAIMMESNGLLKDDGKPFQPPDDFWAEDSCE